MPTRNHLWALIQYKDFNDQKNVAIVVEDEDGYGF